MIESAESSGYAYIDKTGYGPTTIFPAPLPEACSKQSPCTIHLRKFKDDVAFVSIQLNNKELGYFMDRAGRVYWDGK